MGCASSKAAITSEIGCHRGGHKDYLERYYEDRVLGKGEFGLVRLVHDVDRRNDPDVEPLACKELKKGFTFRDNTLYTPLKPEVIERECRILHMLAGKHYTLHLEALYESPSAVYVLTELCSGGEMMEYVTKAYPSGIRTEDVSRISYQLLSAVDHCAKHGVIHRDIKPANIMFKTDKPGAELRLIDFGSGTIDDPSSQTDTADAPSLVLHTTFAGSAFYISPEVFQKKYTVLTDVWSAGVALYVLVAGYPSECLQKAFNLLQSRTRRDWTKFPHMPEDMPESYFELLNEMLRFRHKDRKSAGDLLGCEFAQFHIHLMEGGDDREAEDDFVGLSLDDVAAEAAKPGEEGGPMRGGLSNGSARCRTKSKLIEGSVRRHASYLQYSKFERSLCTLLSTILKNDELINLMLAIDDKLAALGDSSHSLSEFGGTKKISNREKLQVVKVQDIQMLLLDLDLNEAALQMANLRNYSSYMGFAYHIALLRQFVNANQSGGNLSQSVGGGRTRMLTGGDRPSSVHGGDMWSKLKPKEDSALRRVTSGANLKRATSVSVFLSN